MKEIFKSMALSCLFLLIPLLNTFGQVGVNTDGSQPDSKAMLDVKSNAKGFLPPRMTASQMLAIQSPPEGLTVYNTTIKSICLFNGTTWDIGVNRDGQSCGDVTYVGKTYHSVIIGKQCWMKENLNVGIAILGTSDQSNNSVIEKYCYNNLESNCTIYGGLYQWDELMNYTTSSSSNPSGSQGICPSGWHLPSDAEFCDLHAYLDATVNCSTIGWTGTDVGGKLKEPGTTHWSSPNTGATNSSGFTALPAGFRSPSPAFSNLNTGDYTWSATENGSSYAWSPVLSSDLSSISRTGSFTKPYGLSGRCLKD